MIIINVGSYITISGLEGNPELIDQLKEKLIIDNPLYLDAVERGRLTKGIPMHIKLLKKYKNGDYSVPRGYLYKLAEIIKMYNCHVNYSHPKVDLLDFNFQGELKPDQRKAGRGIVAKRFSVLKAPTGSGKTVLAIWTIAKRKVPTLIVVHTKELLYQWRDKVVQFLNVKKNHIGLVGDGHNNYGIITIGIVNSLAKKKIEYPFGTIIIDECHRVPASTFANVINKVNTKYLLGLTATDKRSDGLDFLIYYYMGELAHEINTKKLMKTGRILKPEVKIVETSFNYSMRNIYQRQAMLKKLIECPDRNALIAHKVKRQLKQHPNGVVLVISDRVAHIIKLSQLLEEASVMIGATPNKERRETIEKLEKLESRILLATGQLIGEGFDLPALSSIFLTTPIKFNGRLQQYIGRVLRVAEGKDSAIIYDFDDKCWLLQHSLKSRMNFYRKEGFI
jgi:superfamily II DNA or RNA helicase